MARSSLTHIRFPARFGLFRFRGFRGEDLNVKIYDVGRTDGRTTSDGKSSPGLSSGDLKRAITPVEMANVIIAEFRDT
jgi:hypothetical protein